MKKRILSLLLAVCVAASLLTLPVGAAAAESVSFSDIRDKNTIVAVESLRLMGVLDGYSNNTFRPDGSLTRAQFCKMAVYAMNGSDELGRYSTVTIFPDVKPSYWAAAYINMAAKGKGIIAGYADGRFHPENTVTVGQAVTILLRLLDYTDEDVGGIWPMGHMAVASTIGLTEGVGSDGYANLTRGQAARLFLNLLRADKKEGAAYIDDVGTAVANQMLVSSAALAPDGTNTGLQTADGNIYQLSDGKASNGALNGQKGTLLLNKKGGKVLTFVPDTVGSSKIATVSEAKANLLTLTDGTKYSMTSGIELYMDNEQTTWGKGFALLNSGTSVTLYLSAAGSVEYVFVGGGATANTAVIVYSNRSTTGFASLTGGVSGYSIYKNGVKAGAGDMRKYDVATYSPATNTIRVSDTRITGYYEGCEPNASAPTTATVLGHEFNVLPSAVESLSKFKPGQQVTFLLTEDNQIAGAVEASGTSASGNVVGIVRSLSTSSATVDLLCGITVEGSVSLSQSQADQMSGQLVRVSSGKKGFLSLSRLTGGASGDLDVSARKLGNKPLADNVMIFQNTADGLQAIGLSQINDATISSNQITYAGTDWAGRVKLLVIGGSTSGSTVVYGRVVITTGEDSQKWVYDKGYDEDNDPDREHGEYVTVKGDTSIRIEYGDGKSVGPISSNYAISNGAFVKATLNAAGTRFTGISELKALKNVSSSAWNGVSAVTVNAQTYTVPSDVPCYNRDTRSWMTLAAARAYSDTFNLYVENGVVRVVEVRS